MNLRMSTGPHLLSKDTTQSLMLDVLVALVPATAAGVYFFGTRAALVLAVSIVFAVLSELVWQVLLKKKVRITDLSAVVTGLILGLNLPAGVPLWMPALGSIVGVVLVKQLFGGIGHNFLNPAIFARAVLLASWPVHMTSYLLPQRVLFGSAAQVGVDTVATATPLLASSQWGMMDLFIGNIPGSIGEVSKIAILLGLAYLLVRGTITWHIPTFFVGTVALLSALLGSDPLTAVLTGGVLFGAVFMATDYVTNPTLRVGQCIFGILCGVIVVVIRKYGSYPEGVTFAILFMNCLTPLIDRYSKRKVYGEVKKHA